MKSLFIAFGVFLPLLIAFAQPGSRLTTPLHKDPDGTEIQKPVPVKEQESRVLRSMHAMPIEKLKELLQVYEKLDNKGMMDAIARQILKLDPKNEDALRVRDEVDPKDIVRDPAYLSDLTAKVLKGEVVEDTDAVGTIASGLLEDGHPDQAVSLLEALRRNQFKGKTFPFLDDLAYGYAEKGDLEKAEVAYKAVIADPEFSAESRDEAESALQALAVKKRIASIRQSSGSNIEALAQASAKLYAERPDDEDVLAFRIEALDESRHYDEELALLEPMRAKWHGPGAWPYLPELAHAYQGMKKYDLAIAMFREVQKSPDFDAATKADAESMILEIQVGRLIDKGTSALDKSHFAEAKSILDQLERDYPTHDDVIGFKALYLAKTGRSDEALSILYGRKRLADKEGVPFSQQDILADVYLERKDFGLARMAAQAIVDDQRYDPEFRDAARQKLHEIRVAELLHQGYEALENGRRKFALSLERHLEQIAPGEIEVRIFEAEVALAFNQASYARDLLTELKKSYPDQPFPGQTGLASSLAETGYWEEASNAYAEVLSVPGYEAEEQWDALHSRRELVPLFRPTLTGGMHFEHSKEGSILSAETRFASAWYHNWRFAVFAHSDFTRLSKTNLFGARRDVRTEGGISATRRFEGGYFAEATLGGSQSGVLYGARIGKVSLNSLGWSLGFTGNGRATDSTTLQALNGRENRVEFKLSGPIAERVQVDLEAFFHHVSLGGTSLGSGFGVEGSVDYIVQKETRTRPEILVGYHGEYRRFDASGTLSHSVRDQIRKADVPEMEVRRALGAEEEMRRALAGDFGREVMNDLVDRETNRHGVEIKVRKHFNERWSGYVHAGAYYAFDDSAPGWDASLGVEYWLNDSAMFYAELRYDSDGKGASSGSGTWEADIGGSISF